MSKLSAEEQEILDAFEKGKLKRSEGAAETQKRHQEYAEAMFKKDARINEQYRICFLWGEKGPGKVEITDYH
jgi:plasmid maintenance system killer protein